MLCRSITSRARSITVWRIKLVLSVPRREAALSICCFVSVVARIWIDVSLVDSVGTATGWFQEVRARKAGSRYLRKIFLYTMYTQRDRVPGSRLVQYRGPGALIAGSHKRLRGQRRRSLIVRTRHPEPQIPHLSSEFPNALRESGAVADQPLGNLYEVKRDLAQGEGRDTQFGPSLGVRRCRRSTCRDRYKKPRRCVSGRS